MGFIQHVAKNKMIKYIQIPGMYTGKNKSARKQRKRCSGAMH